MKHYEIVFIVNPDKSDQVPTLVEKYRGFVEADKGTVHRHEDWGRRQLAYPINKLLKGHYVMMNVECGVAALEKIQENFRYSDFVIRNLILERKEAITEKSIMMEPKVDTAKRAPRSDGGSYNSNKSEHNHHAESAVKSTEATEVQSGDTNATKSE